jgi:hypothetical protein
MSSQYVSLIKVTLISGKGTLENSTPMPALVEATTP